jgi:hypothetical protein
MNVPEHYNPTVFKIATGCAFVLSIAFTVIGLLLTLSALSWQLFAGALTLALGLVMYRIFSDSLRGL